ncbi:MAG: hypothetical protein O0W99_00140 [Methanocorpusculum sp.]|nr:hypothetical protein [Methanocorpusculum sp.]MDE2545198.1 hypothetical protein [Methanocorpusculum sp.]MDE2547390.1 hypothetical protein [Methanocorpusculum sp.]
MPDTDDVRDEDVLLLLPELDPPEKAELTALEKEETAELTALEIEENKPIDCTS